MNVFYSVQEPEVISIFLYVIYFRSSSRIYVFPHRILSLHMWHRSLQRHLKLYEIYQQVFEVY
jgi:hypothetical protein